MLLYGRNQHNIVKQLFANLKKKYEGSERGIPRELRAGRFMLLDYILSKALPQRASLQTDGDCPGYLRA